MRLLPALVLGVVLVAAALPSRAGAQASDDAVIAGDTAPRPAPCPRPATVTRYHARETLRRELERYRVEQEWALDALPPRGTPLSAVPRDTAMARYRRAIAAYREAMAHTRRRCRHVPNLILALDVSRPDSAGADVLMLDVVYYYTGEHGSEVSVGAITKLNGESTGHWAYRPVRLAPGLHTARIRLGMNDAGPSTYRSDGVEVEMYVHRRSTFAERLFHVEHTWRRRR